jgi:hypothetical protein
MIFSRQLVWLFNKEPEVIEYVNTKQAGCKACLFNLYLIRIELVQLKLNITRFYAVKYALDFGGGLYPPKQE